MTELIGNNFGLLIAYVLPGFVTLWGMRSLSPTIDSWLSPAPTLPAGIESVVFVGLASVAAGMTVSAIRWAIIDSLHAWMGMPRPTWDDANLDTRVDAFDTIVEAHYRHYLFYANSAIAIPIAYGVRLAAVSATASEFPIALCVAALELLFVATSRDALRKYYARSTRLLGLVSQKERRVPDGQRQQPRQTAQSGKAHRQTHEARK